MKKIVECVPNFSEGRNREIVDAIGKAIRKTEGCRLLDVDPGYSTHRTVCTFVGDPESVVEGALAAARVARQTIDMRHHFGEHPRMGALDVCPFIPVAHVTMDECVTLSRIFGQRLAEELGVPVFLYEASASLDYRRTLDQIREGEYEGLSRKITRKEWKPDFGPAEFVPEWGATVTGARHFLIAYNVNLLATPNQAHRIALNLREAGRGPDEPGRLKAVKGMGWHVREHNLAQVTVNLTDYRQTPPHVLFEQVKKEAGELKVAVTGSEIVGVVPLEAVLMAADHYIEKEDLFILEEDQKIRLVIDRLGLHSVAPFDPEKKIIEYRVAEETVEPLAGMTVRSFINEVAARTTAPGGGSVSAAMAAMGVGLGSMAAKLTQGVRKFEHLETRMRQIIPDLHHTSETLIALIDADTGAYQDYVAALRLPEDTQAEKQEKQMRLEAGLKKAIEVPLSMMALADKAWDAMIEAARYANIASRSDIEVGARALEAGIWGAYRNVLINVAGIGDPNYRQSAQDQADLLQQKARQQCLDILKILEDRER